MEHSPGVDASPAGRVTLRYWASAKAAAGVASDAVDVLGPIELDALVAEAIRRHPGRDRFPGVLRACSVLVSGEPANREGVVVAPGAVVEFLPPFAGG
ncbi:MAG TPA: MoaD/ThiS family protein [Marmoricola sp.]